jgi:hypothetical protein
MVKLMATAMVDVEGGDDERRSPLYYVSLRPVLGDATRIQMHTLEIDDTKEYLRRAHVFAPGEFK